MLLLHFRAMGCQMEARLDSDVPGAQMLLAWIPVWFEVWESILSRFRDDSELSRLNAQAGRGPVKVSTVLWEVLREAMEAAEMSDGLVVPTILPALLASGYTWSFELMASRLWDEQASMAYAPVTTVGAWRSIVLDERRRTVALPAGVQLDLGGVAKGWAAEQAARKLAHHAPALVNAGGDIAVSGPQRDGSPWRVAVADPFHPDRDVAIIKLHRGAVATSGRDYRRWQWGMEWKHHIIDPRRGAPAETDLVSVTAIAERATRAETAAKTVLILGTDEGMRWLTHHADVAALLVREDGDILTTATWSKYMVDEEGVR
ncbi:MAG: FAD:protein FMN transferase [Ardenticatenia bacterium]|nr:FAD:protein FMN transferase [Ardenticatenia bacterium]